jgi:hypothetical protein
MQKTALPLSRAALFLSEALECAILGRWRETIMTKNILDRTHSKGESECSIQFLRIETTTRPRKQTKQLQTSRKMMNPASLTRHFLEIERRGG